MAERPSRAHTGLVSWTVALALAGAVLWSAVDARAVELVGRSGVVAQPYQRWADAANVPTVAGRVVLIATPCPGFVERGCTWRGAPLFMPPTRWRGPLLNRGSLLHELGHRFDYGMSDVDRAVFSRLTGDRRPWRTSPNSQHERFAEAYALCGLGGRAARRYGYGGYGYRPSPATNRAVCRWLRGLR